MTDVYKVGDSYYRADNNQKILNVPELQALKPRLVVTPVQKTGSVAIPNPQEIPNYQVTNQIGGTLYGTPRIVRLPDGSVATENPKPVTNVNPLNQWKNQTEFLQTAKQIIEQKQGMNEQLTGMENYWRDVYTNPERQGLSPDQQTKDPQFVGSWTDESLRQLSPSDQASVRLARQSLAQSNLEGLRDERTYRAITAKDQLQVLTDLYTEKTAALKVAQDQKNTEVSQQLEKDRNNISLLSLYNKAIQDGENITANIVKTKLSDSGMKIDEYIKQDLPNPYTPIKSDLGQGYVSGYGSDVWKYGLDFVLDGGAGTPIVLPFNFEVIKTGVNGGFGNQVQVKNLETGKIMWFSHLQDIQIQKGALGSQFRAGTVIGTMGSTGNSTGPHIDITMPNGKGGYYSATDVAKEIGIQQRLSTSNKKNNWSDTQINNLAIDTGKTIGELNAMTNDQLTQEARKTAPGIVDNLAKKIEPTIMLLGIDTDTAKQILQLIYANEDEQAIIKLMKDNNIVGRTSSDGVQYTPEKIYTILKGASMKQ